MNVEQKLRTILEGTYIQEETLTKHEFDELYEIKSEIQKEKDKLLFSRDPNEKEQIRSKIDALEKRQQDLRSKGLS